MEWDIIEVKPIDNLAIAVQFADGMAGRVVFQWSHLTGVFAALKDPAIFNRVFIDEGAVAWPGNIDLAPDAMYAAIKAHGIWVLK